MEKVTSEIYTFKEAARHIWNIYFSNLMEGNVNDIFSNFDQIEKALFWAIVAAPLNANGIENAYRNGPMQNLIVQLKSSYDRVPIRVGRADSSNNIVWGDAQIINREDEDNFLFIDFFDWNFYGFMDQPYVRFFIKSCRQKPAIEGRSAIVEMRYVDFFFNAEPE